jgi:hypothetical protein
VICDRQQLESLLCLLASLVGPAPTHLRAGIAAKATQADALRGEVQRRRSVHSESVDSVARVAAVGQAQRQELEELRQRCSQLEEAWEQVGGRLGQGRGGRLCDVAFGSGGGCAARRCCSARKGLQPGCAGFLCPSPPQENAQVARLHAEVQEAQAARAEAEAAWQARLAEADCRSQQAVTERAAQEQAAKHAASEAAASEQRRAVAEARACQLEAELGALSAGSEGRGAALADARRRADEATEAARGLQRQLAAERRRCGELEAALAGERERSAAATARAESAEVAQQGLGSHAKAAHARMQQLQQQLADARELCRRLQGEGEEARLGHAADRAALEVRTLRGRGKRTCQHAVDNPAAAIQPPVHPLTSAAGCLQGSTRPPAACLCAR